MNPSDIVPSEAPYKPPYAGQPYAQAAIDVYHDLVGCGHCSGREDDRNIEKIRATIERVCSAMLACKK